MIVKSAIRDMSNRWRTVLSIHLLFTLLGITLLTPLFATSMRVVVAMSGSAAVADQDIAMLVLTPVGIVTAIALIALLLAISGLEMAALQAVAHARQSLLYIGAVDAVLWALRRIDAVLRLTFHLTLRVLVYLAPFAAVVALIAFTLLRDYDINYYLSARPTPFLVALALGALATLVLFILLGRRLLGWSLVLPLVLFAGVRPIDAFKVSERHTRGSRRTCARALIAWLLLALVTAALPAIFLQLATSGVMGSGLVSLNRLLGMLLLIALLWSVLLFFVGAWNLGLFAFVIERLYKTLDGPLGKDEHLPLVAQQQLHGRPLVIGLALALLATIALASGVSLLGGINIPDKAMVMAHRGAAGAAPENTIAAVRRAVADGADWVEIDVQESRDGHLVVVHDSDFMKLAGNPLKVWNGDLEEIRAIDVGGWFDVEFAGERVPTLEEVLQEVRGKTRLLIELKYYGHDQRLEQRVIDAVEAAGMSDNVMIMSLHLPGLQVAQKLRPDWRTGLLAATAVGDLTRLDVDFLAVNQNIASPGFIKRAHKRGKQVYVWTVNDALSMSRWMSLGVDGIITDEPALAVSVLRQRAELSTAERLLLSLATLMGRPEIALHYRDNSP